MRARREWSTTRFNTTLVQLKEEGEGKGGLGERAKFQYHTGPIKSLYELYKDADLSRLFQYHTGPIKSSSLACKSSTAVLVFQYHTGPIKSTMWDRVHALWRKFQYHTGPIKRASVGLYGASCRLFQYHTGPIKRTRTPYSNGIFSISCFNTTLVQLKVLVPCNLASDELEVSIPHWSN